jgi:hypothetical protein
MANILITGNGFDLAHGLPTRYSDFIDYFKSDDLKGHPIHENVWFKYFGRIKNIVTWIDFEQEISNALKMICKISSYAINKNFDKFDDPNIFNMKAVLNDYEIELLSILEVITPSGDDYKVISPYYCSKTKCFKNALINTNLFGQLNEFCNYLNYYLKGIESDLKKSNQVKSKKSPLRGFDRICTFNYTNFITELYGVDATKIHHLHGILTNKKKKSDKNQDSPIVLGVNELTDEQQKYLGVGALGFTKYFQTIYKSCDTGALYNLKVNPDELLSFTFWGHSLDKSDKKYIKHVFKLFEDHLDKYIGDENDKNKITIYYHNDESKASMLKNLLDIIGQEDIEKLAYSKKLVFEESPAIFKS